jgi:glutathione-regulated potassium-efflux system ancillary protein KefG
MANPKKTLILFAHPAIHKSRVNRAMMDAVKNLENVTFHDLYAAYPDLYIDVEKEKKLLLEHELIILQHPFYWYSTPAILKEWSDLVLEFGFAYGPGGDNLVNKFWMHAISTGGPEAAYQSTGYNRYTMRQLLAPWDQTAYLCGMVFIPPFVIHGSLKYNQSADLKALGEEYKNIVLKLQNEEINIRTLNQLEKINQKEITKL